MSDFEVPKRHVPHRNCRCCVVLLNENTVDVDMILHGFVAKRYFENVATRADSCVSEVTRAEARAKDTYNGLASSENSWGWEENCPFAAENRSNGFRFIRPVQKNPELDKAMEEVAEARRRLEKAEKSLENLKAGGKR